MLLAALLPLLAPAGGLAGASGAAQQPAPPGEDDVYFARSDPLATPDELVFTTFHADPKHPLKVLEFESTAAAFAFLADAHKLMLTSLSHVEDMVLPGSRELLLKTLPSLAEKLPLPAVPTQEEDRSDVYIDWLQVVLQALERLSPATTGYPVVRRVLLATIIRRRLHTGPWSNTVRQLVLRICRQLFDLHKQAFAAKGAIEFMHISKSGGTSMCQVAAVNGCATRNFSTTINCMIREFSDRPRWVSAAWHRAVQLNITGAPGPRPWFLSWSRPRAAEATCAVRAAVMRENGFNFYANEYTTHGNPQAQSTVRRWAGTTGGGEGRGEGEEEEAGGGSQQCGD